MDAVLGREEALSRAEAFYEQIRPEVEEEENIGRLILIDIYTGDYVVATDELGFEAARALRQHNPAARPVALRIGYNAVDAIGGVLERTV